MCNLMTISTMVQFEYALKKGDKNLSRSCALLILDIEYFQPMMIKLLF